MKLSEMKLILGFGIYTLALFFLLVCIVAAIQTWRTGRFSSGVHIVPTVFALIGTINTGWSWKPFFMVVFLDLGILFLTVKRRSTEADSVNGKKRGG